MANEINITVAAQEDASTTLEGVGASAVRTERVIVQAMGSTEQSFDTAARSTGRLGSALDSAAGAGGGVADGLGGAGDAAQSMGDIMNYSERKAEDLARAQTEIKQAAQDAEQALQDLEQANRDLAQAEIDSEQAAQDSKQAVLDFTVAQKAYNEAVKEHGKNSEEAQQAALDLNQATLDKKQALEDAKQAQQDMVQADLDAKQSAVDHTAATNDLAAANRGLIEQSSGLTKVSEWGGMLSGVLGGLVGVIGLITTVQWAWNAALAANPIGLIVIGIALLIGIIVLIATKTTWFQDLWDAIWSRIGDKVKAIGKGISTAFKATIDFVVNAFKTVIGIPGKVGKAFEAIGGAITAPFRGAFNYIARAWNNTVGQLWFSIPSWVPGLGGNSFGMPKLPTLATGGEILRTGAVLAHKGERIMPANTRGLFNDNMGASASTNDSSLMSSLLMMLQNQRLSLDIATMPGTGDKLMDAIVSGLAYRIRTVGQGDVQGYLGGGKV